MIGRLSEENTSISDRWVNSCSQKNSLLEVYFVYGLGHGFRSQTPKGKYFLNKGNVSR